VAHSAKHMSLLMCIASCTVIWLLLYFLVLSPLWFLYSMHPPHFMLPSVCLMLTFPIAPWLALIVLWVPIWLVIVFKPLVFTHVPQFEYCCYQHYSICLTLLACLPLWVSKTQFPVIPEIWERIGASGATFIGWSRSSLVTLSLLVLVPSIGSRLRDQARCALTFFPSPVQFITQLYIGLFCNSLCFTWPI